MPQQRRQMRGVKGAEGAAKDSATTVEGLMDQQSGGDVALALAQRTGNHPPSPSVVHTKVSPSLGVVSNALMRSGAGIGPDTDGVGGRPSKRVKIEGGVHPLPTSVGDGMIRRGRWSPGEHALFQQAMEKHPYKWREVAKVVKTRTELQCRTHAQKTYTPTNAGAPSPRKTQPASSSRSGGSSSSSSCRGPTSSEDLHGALALQFLASPHPSSSTGGQTKTKTFFGDDIHTDQPSLQPQPQPQPPQQLKKHNPVEAAAALRLLQHSPSPNTPDKFWGQGASAYVEKLADRLAEPKVEQKQSQQQPQQLAEQSIATPMDSSSGSAVAAAVAMVQKEQSQPFQSALPQTVLP